jgi:putative glycosyl hydrolase-like family 15 (GHL15) protein
MKSSIPFVAVAALALALLPAPALGQAGAVRFLAVADSSFDRYTADPSADEEAWMRAHYFRLLAYAPYFDSRVSWFPNAWAYKDLYAIYVGSSEALQHPGWILHDLAGNPLYIPWGCGNGACPQYAGDVGNADFRAQWIAQARATLSAGYRGLYVDDVNLAISRVSDGWANPVLPRDPRTGQAMTDAAWRQYMADFTAQIRAAFPSIEIVHNALWFIGDGDPSVQREIAASNWVGLERGVNDAGIRGGGGTSGFDTFLAHIDFVHRAGRAVVFDAAARGRAAREYGLAVYLLVDGGGDMLGNQSSGTPTRWWPGYDVSLGGPASPRYAWSGLVRRDFRSGLVLVNPPDAPTQRVTLDVACRDLRGRSRTSVRLRAASGAVFQCP